MIFKRIFLLYFKGFNNIISGKLRCIVEYCIMKCTSIKGKLCIYFKFIKFNFIMLMFSKIKKEEKLG